MNKNSKGFAPFLILVVVAGIAAIFLAFNLFAIPKRGNPNAVEPFNSKDVLMLGEKITYLFRNPEVGEAIIFVPAAGEKSSGIADYIGIITEFNEDKDIRTYEVVSSPGKAWKITKDKIRERIYYPRVTKSHLEKARASNKGSNDPTANWKTYTSSKLGFTLKYPAGWVSKEGTEGPEFAPSVDLLAPGDSENFSPVFVFVKIVDNFDLSPTTLNQYQEKDVVLDGIITKRVTGTTKSSAQNSVRFTGVKLNHNGKIYGIITVGEDYLSVFDQILSSFRFLGQASDDLKSACENVEGKWINEFRECESMGSTTLTPQWCLNLNGKFFACESLCRNDPKFKSGQSGCADVCVKVCKLN